MMKRLAVVLMLVAVCGYAYAGVMEGKNTRTGKHGFTLPLAPQAADTVEWAVANCDLITLFGTFTADTSRYVTEYGYINTWVPLDTVSVYNAGTPAATNVWKPMLHKETDDELTSDVMANLHTWLKFRVRFYNLDDTTNGSGDKDTVSVAKFMLICKDK